MHGLEYYKCIKVNNNKVSTKKKYSNFKQYTVYHYAFSSVFFSLGYNHS